MTPPKCFRHEYRPGELADGPRYTQALIDSQTCWHCRILAWRARLLWALGVRG